jgi:hypothetical protein
MTVKTMQAAQILENALLDDLLESYKYMQFEHWANEKDHEKREQIFGRINGVNDLHCFIQNKCQGIIDGH